MALSPTRVSPEPCLSLTTADASLPPLPPARPLSGGTANRGLVIRVGDTVVRPAAPCRPATHALLGHLAAAGFDGAPRVLATGPFTETLTYIDGRAGVPPLAEDTLTDSALVSVADLVRRYHQAAASFDPSGYQWPRPIPARFRTGLVSHNDVHPANLVFLDGRAVALIDFDLAGPASAIWDFAAAARYWAPLQDDQDITDSRRSRALEPRGMSGVGTMCVCGGAVSPSMRPNRIWAASVPMARTSWATTLTGGSSMSASGRSSKPTRAVRRWAPQARSARTVPRVIRFWLLNSAVGGSGPLSRVVTAASAASAVCRSWRVIAASAGSPASRITSRYPV